MQKKELLRLELELRKEISAWKAKKSHSSQFKVGYYLDSGNRHYDWRESERRRTQLKEERGLN